jgi:hypothetical protein
MSKFTESVAAYIEKHPTLYICVLKVENAFKKPAFKCQECGECILSTTAFTCPMRCPKELRNGPCGGTRPDGHCEAYPERDCIWHLIYTRAEKLDRLEMLTPVQKPHDHRLKGSSAWLNMMAGRIPGWKWRKSPKG